jgi:hypothetical protein
MECPLAQTFLFFEMPSGILHFVTPNTLKRFSWERKKKAKLDVSYLLAKVQKEEEAEKKMKCFFGGFQ